MGKSKSNSHHDFDQCSLRHRTTVKALGSLESGFSHPMGLNSRLGGDLPALKLFYSQANICLCFDAAAWRGWFFRIVTLLGSWTIFPGNSGLLFLFTSRLIISVKQRLVNTWKVRPIKAGGKRQWLPTTSLSLGFIWRKIDFFNGRVKDSVIITIHCQLEYSCIVPQRICLLTTL